MVQNFHKSMVTYMVTRKAICGNPWQATRYIQAQEVQKGQIDNSE